MKRILLAAMVLICAQQISAQQATQYLQSDSARYIISHAKTEKEKFPGYYYLDRYYYTTGLYDSSRLVQAKMYSIAGSLNDDSLLTDTYHAIGNMLVHKSDYNFSLSNYFKALEHAKDNYRKAKAYAALGYVYILTGNDAMGYEYEQKADALTTAPTIKKVVNIFLGMAFNHLNKPDSALMVLQKAETDPTLLDATMNSVLLGSLSLSYEIKKDHDLADVYYKKTLDYCKKQKLVSSYIRNANRYCSYLLTQEDYDNAKILAGEIRRINPVELCLQEL